MTEDSLSTIITASMLAPQTSQDLEEMLKQANLTVREFINMCESWEKAMEWGENQYGDKKHEAGAHFGSGFVAGLAWAKKEKELPEA